jgi:hypothetical protein
MKRRERERAPAALGWAAPVSWWLSSWIAGVVGGVIVVALGGPLWVVWLSGPFAGLLADIYWRRTRPPTEDARWSPLARVFFKRTPPKETT